MRSNRVIRGGGVPLVRGRSGTCGLLLALLCGLVACEGESESVAVDDPVDAGLPVDAEVPDEVPDAEVDAETPDADLRETYTAQLDLPETPFNYAAPEIPAHFSVETLGFNAQRPAMQTDNTPAINRVTDAGATLGRVLFYDRNLSLNRTVACASCHEAEAGFSDPDVFSEGFDGELTERHSMTIINARFFAPGSFFWDQRAGTLEEQVLLPFQDPVEMGMSLDGLIERIELGEYYPPLFEAAFGDPRVTPDRVAWALAQFVRSMVSVTSRYDVGRAMVQSRDDEFPNFSPDENLGKSLFVLPPPLGGFGCFFCHRGEAFIANQARSNGLDAEPEDDGFGAISGREADQGTFKVPSLRNVAVRAPFMHDGRFATLDEVIDHYSDGVQPHVNLGPPFGILDGEVPQLRMTSREKKALVLFLETLTDPEMLSDPKFSDPFVRE